MSCSSPRDIKDYSRDAHGALTGLPGPSSPYQTTPSNSDSNNNVFLEKSINDVFSQDNEEIDNVYDRKEKMSSGEKAKILDPLHPDGNLVYIVRAIIEDKSSKDKSIKEKHHCPGFVMIQECKESAYKKWYLPAGMVNRHENIEEAVVRVVHEEAGLKNGHAEHIILIEEIGPFWFRFTYLVTFNDLNILKSLKTERDRHSIKAEIWKFEDIMRRQQELRDEDMLRAIKEFRRMNQTRHAIPKAPLIPDHKWRKLGVELVSRDYITIRAVFLFETKKEPWMLLHRKSKKVPIVSCWSAIADKCIHTSIFRFIKQVHDIESLHWYSYSTLGVTCIDNCKSENTIGGQGLRMTVVFQVKSNHQLSQKVGKQISPEIPKIKPSSDYTWQQMPNCNQLIRRITSYQTILTPLQSPRLIKTGHDKEIHLDQWHANPLFSSGIKR